MITRAEYGYPYRGLSIDNKDEISGAFINNEIPNGAKFFEMDTNKHYIYDAQHHVWIFLPGEGGSSSAYVAGSGITINEDEISVDTTIIATKEYAEEIAIEKANGAKPIAGTGISVNDTQVSVNTSTIATRTYVEQQATAAKPVAGIGISVSGTTVSADTSVMATREYVDNSVGVQFTVTDVIVDE